MATLCLGDVECSTPVLQEWLSGDWALLFSHPEDFRYQGLEDDRWLDILRDEFRAQGVRPLACARGSADADSGWVSQLLGDQGFVRLELASAVPSDLPARSLRDEILALPARFVLIVDQALRRRGVLQYLPGGGNRVSPLDLLASVGQLRRSTTLAQAA